MPAMEAGMATLEGNGIPWWGRELQRRLENIETLKPEVMSDRIVTALEEIKSLRRSFYTFAFSVVLAAVVFAFSVFSLLGKHP